MLCYLLLCWRLLPLRNRCCFPLEAVEVRLVLVDPVTKEVGIAKQVIPTSNSSPLEAVGARLVLADPVMQVLDIARQGDLLMMTGLSRFTRP